MCLRFFIWVLVNFLCDFENDVKNFYKQFPIFGIK